FCFFILLLPSLISTLFPYTTLFRSIFLTPLLNIFGATDKVFPYALTYTSINTFGLPFYILSTSGSFLIRADGSPKYAMFATLTRSEEHTSELQSRFDLVCRLLLEKK